MALALVALIWLGLPNLVPRPVLFSFVLLALLVVVLEVEAEWATSADSMGMGRRARILCAGTWICWFLTDSDAALVLRRAAPLE